jgi:hypothetical protein
MGGACIGVLLPQFEDIDPNTGVTQGMIAGKAEFNLAPAGLIEEVLLSSVISASCCSCIRIQHFSISLLSITRHYSLLLLSITQYYSVLSFSSAHYYY